MYRAIYMSQYIYLLSLPNIFTVALCGSPVMALLSNKDWSIVR